MAMTYGDRKNSLRKYGSIKFAEPAIAPTPYFLLLENGNGGGYLLLEDGNGGGKLQLENGNG